MFKRMLVLVLVVMIVCGSVDAGIFDKFKDVGEKVGDSVDKAKKSWDAKEKKCSECGRTIHLGTVCASCKAKAARDAARRAKERVDKTASETKKKWDAREKKCSECGRTIHLGTVCSSCKAKAMKKRGGEIVDSSKKAWQKTKPELIAAKERIADRYTVIQEGAKKVYSTAKERYPKVLNRIRDPETRKKATDALGAVMEFRKQVKDTKNKIIHDGLSALSEISISTEDGDTTLGEWGVSHLLEKYPGLEDTGICEDPVATVAAIVGTDTKYFLKNVKLIEKDGEKVSVSDAIEESSAFDGSSDIIKRLKVAEAAMDVAYCLSTGEDVGEAVVSVVGAVDAVND